MPVMANDAGRADIGFARGTRFQWACKWETSQDGGQSFNPVDLTAWDCRVQLYDTNDLLLLEKPCSSATSDGIAVSVIDAADTNTEIWEGRRQGTWRVIAAQSNGDALSVMWSGAQDASTSLLQTVPDLENGDVELLGWGYWRID